MRAPKSAGGVGVSPGMADGDGRGGWRVRRLPRRQAAECAPYEAHFPGEVGCTTVGTRCPASDFPEGLPLEDPSSISRPAPSSARAAAIHLSGVYKSFPLAMAPGTILTIAKGTTPARFRPGGTAARLCLDRVQITGAERRGPYSFERRFDGMDVDLVRKYGRRLLHRSRGGSDFSFDEKEPLCSEDDPCILWARRRCGLAGILAPSRVRREWRSKWMIPISKSAT